MTKTVVTSEIKLKQNSFTETKHCFALVLFQFYFRCNHCISRLWTDCRETRISSVPIIIIEYGTTLLIRGHRLMLGTVMILVLLATRC